MDISCSPEEAQLLQRIGEVAAEINVRCYLIGGFVRDKLLGRGCKDIDVVCVGNGIDLAHAVAATYRPKPKVSFFKNFGTAHFNYKGFDVEFVGARKESYLPHSRKPEVLEGTLEDDQLRRDFTINALAIDLNKEHYGKLIDPFNGLEDLKHQIIRTPLDPNVTFSDDPLRMMRGIRFATQLGFEIFSETLEAIKSNSERIKIISQERITDELN
jgi:tRNA nucleotidyltransferase/poly(A) polymerase